MRKQPSTSYPRLRKILPALSYSIMMNITSVSARHWTNQGKPCLKLIAYSMGKPNTETAIPLQESDADKKIYLKVTGNEPQTAGESVYYTFSYSFSPQTDWVQAGEPVSADLLSTQTAGGFTGTMVGIYATGDYNEQGDYNNMKKEK